MATESRSFSFGGENFIATGKFLSFFNRLNACSQQSVILCTLPHPRNKLSEIFHRKPLDLLFYFQYRIHTSPDKYAGINRQARPIVTLLPVPGNFPIAISRINA